MTQQDYEEAVELIRGIRSSNLRSHVAAAFARYFKGPTFNERDFFKACEVEPLEIDPNEDTGNW